MSPDEVVQIESDLTHVHFRDAKVALAAALNEVRVAAASLDAAQQLGPSSALRSAWLRPSAGLQSSVAKFGWPSILHSPARGGATKPHTTRRIVMSNKHRVFEQLGRNANGGPLQPPFDEPTTASDVAIAIHAVLVEVGLSPAAIRNVGARSSVKAASMSAVVMMQHTPARPGERITRDGLPWPCVSRGHQTPHRRSIMSPNDQEIFWQLGSDAGTGGPLPPRLPLRAGTWRPPYRDDLTEVGLSSHAIRRVACALLSVSVTRSTKRGCGAPPARQARGGER